MGEALIAGTASLLICVFLSPKFIEFLREREFGQQIREEGPQEHHAKAGTPTMGGIIIFTAIAVPFLLLTSVSPRAVGVFGVALACALLGFAAGQLLPLKALGVGMIVAILLDVTVVRGLPGDEHRHLSGARHHGGGAAPAAPPIGRGRPSPRRCTRRRCRGCR